MGFAAFAMLIVLYGWGQDELADKMTRNPLSRAEVISGMYERANECSAILFA